MTFVTHAQNFEDVILWRALGQVPAGTYVDIGAQDPERDSVSLAFYQAGWRGIHVEATPNYAAKLRASRPDEIVIEAAATDDPGPIVFYEIPDTGLSTGMQEIAEKHEQAGRKKQSICVPTVRLDGIFELLSDREIHWLKVDVEGMEANVLRSWGEHRARPWLLVIEATLPGSQERSHSTWLQEVLRRGYREVLFDGLSRYFLHEAHLELLQQVETAANVFDGFAIGRDHFAAVDLRDELQALEQDREAIRGELAEQSQLHAVVRSELEATRASTEELTRAHAEDRAQLIRDFDDKFSSLQKDSFKQQADHEAALKDLQDNLAAARIDNARLDERNSSLQHRIEEGRRREELFFSERARLDEEIARLHEEHRQSWQLSTAVQLELANAHQAIKAAKAAWPSRLQWIKCGLGLSPPPRAWQDLAAYPATNGHLVASQSPTQRQADGEITRMTNDLLTRGNPYLRANSLAELLAWDDLNFVRCAYVTILGRQPDPAGEAHYVRKLRQGHAKLEMLWHLRKSAEGQRHDPGIAGLDRALRRARSERRPGGWIVRFFTKGEDDSAATRRSRATLNELRRFGEGQQLTMARIEKIEGLVGRLATNSLDTDHQGSHRLRSQRGQSVQAESNVAQLLESADYTDLGPATQRIFRKLITS